MPLNRCHLIGFVLIVGLLTSCAMDGAGPDTSSPLRVRACAKGEPEFAYSTQARNLQPRQTDVATLRDGKQVYLTEDALSLDPSFNSDASRIVFSSGRDAPAVDFEYGNAYKRLALFTSKSTGGDRQRLTRGPLDMEPAWSPTGSTIVFVRDRGPGSFGDGGEQLWTVDAETKEAELLLRAPAEHIKDSGEPYLFYSPTWSPDGKHIAFSRSDGMRDHSLWIMKSDGSDVREILGDAGPDYRGFSDLDPKYPRFEDLGPSYYDSPGLDWSPDGERLAYHAGGFVIIMDLDDQELHILARGEWPAWSRDSARIAYFDRTRLTIVNREGRHRTLVRGAYGLSLDWALCSR